MVHTINALSLLDNYHHGRSKLSAGAITGITVGVVLSFLVLSTSLIIVVCICVRRYCKNRRRSAYVLLQKQYPRLLVATASDSEACVPAQNIANEYTDECSAETTPTNSSDTGLSLNNITTATTTVSNDVPIVTQDTI